MKKAIVTHAAPSTSTVHYTRGSSSGYAYYPSATSWTTKSSFTVNVK
jgi:hypothetical protein